MRKERLEELLNLAQTYRGWSRRRLAEALGRDASNLVPDSGIPKLDLVVELAKVLDWPVEDVVTSLWEEDRSSRPTAEEKDIDFDTLNDAAKSAHREGRYTDMIEIARRSFAVAQTSEQRALACSREAGGWDGLGRYRELLDAIQRGLREADLTESTRLKLQVNLAIAYYSLWHLTEAFATSHVLVQHFEVSPAAGRIDSLTQAFAHYVRGHTERRLMAYEHEATVHHATGASCSYWPNGSSSHLQLSMAINHTKVLRTHAMEV
ncbi:MAG: hypothetical protein ACYTGG_02305 [Planctomycetota bacterium]|jgi:hypothetical protein